MTAVPLSRLRVMPPQGAPVLHGSKAGILCPATPNPQWVNFVHVDTLAMCSVRIEHVALDLSAPTTDRIDGADVAARMLAQAAGLDVSQGVTWGASANAGGNVYVDTPDGCHAWNVSADAADPRDILAAVLLAVLGAP